MEKGFDGFSAGAVVHAWRSSLSPWPLPLPHGERKGERGAGEKENVGNPSRNGRMGMVRAQ